MSVLSRTGLGVALLLVGLFVFYAALLDARATGAQTDGGTTGGTTDGTTDQSDEECENAQFVAAFEGSPGEDLPRSESFQVEANQFRVSVEDDGTGFASVSVTINDADEEFEEDSVDFFTVNSEDEQNSLIVNADAGSYFVEVDASGDAGYTVTVEDCGGNGGGNDDEDTDDDGVIDNTIPDKDLPDTGGSTALVVGGSTLLLLYGGLVAWRLKTRER